MNRVLVALDPSARSEPVLHYASELAKRTGGRLVLFRAVGIPIDLPTQVFAVSPSELGPVLLEQARTALAKAAASLPPGLVESTETELGTPWQAICATATRVGADLVVIGSHGYGALDRLIGTTAARVVNHAPCPVLVVRNASEHPV